MSANLNPLPPLTSSSGGVMPQGEEVASFTTYPEVQRAIDALSDQGFPMQYLAIIGTDLHQVERITGRMSWGKAAISRTLNDLWIGVFSGIIMLVAGSSGPRLNFWACVSLEVLQRIVSRLFSYVLTRGRRDFTSISQVAASRYSILAAREIHEVGQALVNAPGNLAHGAGALRCSQGRRRTRQEAPGPTAFGSRPDEQPHFGVRLPQPDSDAPEQTLTALAGSIPGAPSVAEGYDLFLRSSRSEGRKEPRAPASSQESGDETGPGDKGWAALRDEGAR